MTLSSSKPSKDMLAHQVFSGTTWHHRLLPAKHKFAYPYRYWGVNITALAAGQALPEVDLALNLPLLKNRKLLKHRKLRLPLFSGTHKALQQFFADDYCIGENKSNGDQEESSNDSEHAAQALERRLKQTFIEQTGSAPTGEMMGMLVCRNAGMYFSPVNFYLGFDEGERPTHLLAEVSNTPWNKHHYYGFLLDGADSTFCHDKDFHVSPFNPIDQQYRWQVHIDNQADDKQASDKQTGDTLKVRISIDISDARGEVLKTGIKMGGVAMNSNSIQDSLRKNPLMNLSSLTRIYAHAFKLYAIKKVPYIHYDEKLDDSQSR